MLLDFIYDIILHYVIGLNLEQKVSKGCNVIYFTTLPKLKQLKKASTLPLK